MLLLAALFDHFHVLLVAFYVLHIDICIHVVSLCEMPKFLCHNSPLTSSIILNLGTAACRVGDMHPVHRNGSYVETQKRTAVSQKRGQRGPTAHKENSGHLSSVLIITGYIHLHHSKHLARLDVLLS